MRITVYGTGTSGHQAVIDTIYKFTSRAKIDCNISSVTDVNTFLEKQLESVPAVQINNGKIASLHNSTSFNRSLRLIVQEILTQSQYGEMQKVLIPIDFSDTSINSFHYGHRVASDMGAMVRLLHSTPTYSKETTEGAIISDETLLNKKHLLSQFADNVNVDWGSELLTTALVEKELRQGITHHQIISSVDDHGADLIILGAKGETNCKCSFLGSVTQNLSAHANTPLIIVPEKAHYRGIEKIVYLNDSNHKVNTPTLEYLKQFTDKMNAQLHLINLSNDGFSYSVQAQSDSKAVTSHKSMQSNLSTKDQKKLKTLNDYVASMDVDLLVLPNHKSMVFKNLTNKAYLNRFEIANSTPLMILNK